MGEDVQGYFLEIAFDLPEVCINLVSDFRVQHSIDLHAEIWLRCSVAARVVCLCLDAIHTAACILELVIKFIRLATYNTIALQVYMRI